MLPEPVKVGMKKHKLKTKLSESIQMIPLLNNEMKKNDKNNENDIIRTKLNTSI